MANLVDYDDDYSYFNDVVTSKDPAATIAPINEVFDKPTDKPSDNNANIAMHKARYLHFINERYLKAKKPSAAILKARGELFISILEKKSVGTAKERHKIKERKFKMIEVDGVTVLGQSIAKKPRKGESLQITTYTTKQVAWISRRAKLSQF